MAYQDYSAGIGKSAFNNGNFGIGQKDLREYLLYGDSNAGVPIHLSDVAQDKLLWIAVGNDAVENFCRTAKADFLRWLDDVKVILGLTMENRSRA